MGFFISPIRLKYLNNTPLPIKLDFRNRIFSKSESEEQTKLIENPEIHHEKEGMKEEAKHETTKVIGNEKEKADLPKLSNDIQSLSLNEQKHQTSDETKQSTIVKSSEEKQISKAKTTKPKFTLGKLEVLLRKKGILAGEGEILEVVFNGSDESKAFWTGDVDEIKHLLHNFSRSLNYVLIPGFPDFYSPKLREFVNPNDPDYNSFCKLTNEEFTAKAEDFFRKLFSSNVVQETNFVQFLTAKTEKNFLKKTLNKAADFIKFIQLDKSEESKLCGSCQTFKILDLFQNHAQELRLFAVSKIIQGRSWRKFELQAESSRLPINILQKENENALRTVVLKLDTIISDIETAKFLIYSIYSSALELVKERAKKAPKEEKMLENFSFFSILDKADTNIYSSERRNFFFLNEQIEIFIKTLEEEIIAISGQIDDLTSFDNPDSGKRN